MEAIAAWRPCVLRDARIARSSGWGRTGSGLIL